MSFDDPIPGLAKLCRLSLGFWDPGPEGWKLLEGGGGRKEIALGVMHGADVQDPRPVSSSVAAMLENLEWIRLCFSSCKVEAMVGKKHRLVDQNKLAYEIPGNLSELHI